VCYVMALFQYLHVCPLTLLDLSTLNPPSAGSFVISHPHAKLGKEGGQRIGRKALIYCRAEGASSRVQTHRP